MLQYKVDLFITQGSYFLSPFDPPLSDLLSSFGFLSNNIKPVGEHGSKDSSLHPDSFPPKVFFVLLYFFWMLLHLLSGFLACLPLAWTSSRISNLLRLCALFRPEFWVVCSRHPSWLWIIFCESHVFLIVLLTFRSRTGGWEEARGRSETKSGNVEYSILCGMCYTRIANTLWKDYHTDNDGDDCSLQN